MRITFLFSLLALFCIIGCGSDDDIVCNDGGPVGDLTDIPYDPVPHEVTVPIEFPMVPVPPNNPLTVDGTNLGRHLFYDPILSVDGSTACADCHLPSGGFTDNLTVSAGVGGALGTRSSMTLINAAYYFNGLFWDGRVQSLEEQALLPVEDEVELMHQWADVEVLLQNHDEYPTMFRKAFGITNKSEITKELAAKAIAQFERCIVSAGNSKYDRVIALDDFFSEAEQNGFDMFFDAEGDLPDAECGHCHNAPLFTTNEYFNNGLDAVESLFDFEDPGLGAVTMNEFDYGKFRAPTLRNIEFTAPYMHDGRFETLEEVIDHYNSGGHFADNVDPLIDSLHLSEQNKADLLAFLLTLSDTTTLQNPAYQSPF